MLVWRALAKFYYFVTISPAERSESPRNFRGRYSSEVVRLVTFFILSTYFVLKNQFFVSRRVLFCLAIVFVDICIGNQCTRFAIFASESDLHLILHTRFSIFYNMYEASPFDMHEKKKNVQSYVVSGIRLSFLKKIFPRLSDTYVSLV